jgi:hypothetical protein
MDLENKPTSKHSKCLSHQGNVYKQILPSIQEHVKFNQTAKRSEENTTCKLYKNCTQKLLSEIVCSITVTRRPAGPGNSKVRNQRGFPPIFLGLR